MLNKLQELTDATPAETLLLAIHAGLDLMHLHLLGDRRQTVLLDITQTLLNLVEDGLTWQHLEKTQPELMAKVKEKFAAQRVQ